MSAGQRGKCKCVCVCVGEREEESSRVFAVLWFVSLDSSCYRTIIEHNGFCAVCFCVFVSGSVCVCVHARVLVFVNVNFTLIWWINK